MQWWSAAACASEDPELFFPVGTMGPALGDEQEAKRICMRCPVLEPCLSWALESGETHGIWGGTNAEERAGRRTRAGRFRTVD